MDEEKRTNLIYLIIVAVIVIVGAVVILYDRVDPEEVEKILEQVKMQPKEEKKLTKVQLNCVRANNTSCVIDGTCPRFEQHFFLINETDYLDGEFFWYNNSWCETEWR